MMYHACNRPGMKPRMQRQILMKESAEQTPHLTHCRVEVNISSPSGRDRSLVQ